MLRALVESCRLGLGLGQLEGHKTHCSQFLASFLIIEVHKSFPSLSVFVNVKVMFQGQSGWNSEQPGLLTADPVHGRVMIFNMIFHAPSDPGCSGSVSLCFCVFIVLPPSLCFQALSDNGAWFGKRGEGQCWLTGSPGHVQNSWQCS